MELNYSNLTDPNQNNLKYRKQFENFQKEKCKSKTMLNMENRIHYNRILNALNYSHVILKIIKFTFQIIFFTRIAHNEKVGNKKCVDKFFL